MSSVYCCIIVFTVCLLLLLFSCSSIACVGWRLWVFLFVCVLWVLLVWGLLDLWYCWLLVVVYLNNSVVSVILFFWGWNLFICYVVWYCLWLFDGLVLVVFVGLLRCLRLIWCPLRFCLFTDLCCFVVFCCCFTWL